MIDKKRHSPLDFNGLEQPDASSDRAFGGAACQREKAYINMGRVSYLLALLACGSALQQAPRGLSRPQQSSRGLSRPQLPSLAQRGVLSTGAAPRHARCAALWAAKEDALESEPNGVVLAGLSTLAAVAFGCGIWSVFSYVSRKAGIPWAPKRDSSLRPGAAHTLQPDYLKVCRGAVAVSG